MHAPKSEPEEAAAMMDPDLAVVAAAAGVPNLPATTSPEADHFYAFKARARSVDLAATFMRRLPAAIFANTPLCVPR